MDSADYYHPCEGQVFKDAMRQLAEDEMFAMLAAKLYPELSVDAAKEKILSLKSASQFQSTVMYRGCEYVIEHSMSQFNCSGLENLDGRPTLFISNHRDIVLDAMLLQYVLVKHHRDTTHVVVGSNLWEMPLMAILARANKMYGIGRGGNHREYYTALMEMSHYLRHVVTERHESAWIAQRNGRTKDGKDRTDPALLKMIAASGNRDNPVKALEDMNIVPISMSYEWEPCDILKARETSLRQQGPYTKQPGEDTRSIIQGITDFKGEVHLHFCKPLQHAELVATQGNFEAVANLIDSRIASGHLMSINNLQGYQLIHLGNPITDKDCPFLQHIDKACEQYPGDEAFRQALLGIYGNALANSVEIDDKRDELRQSGLAI